MGLLTSTASAPTESEGNAKTTTIHITEGFHHVIILVNSLFLCGIISFFGAIGNIINLVVFSRQGLHTTINISFFALALSDLSCLLLQLWMILVSFAPYFGLPIAYLDFVHMTGGWPHETFSRLTCSITVYITAERCLCVLFPMSISQIITQKRTTVIILCIYITAFVSWIPLYNSGSIGWTFYLSENRTLLGAVVTPGEAEIHRMLDLTNAGFGIIQVAGVAFFTLVLTSVLKKKSAWRRSANIQHKNAEALSSRDRTTLTMVVLIAFILLVCYTPSVVLCVVAFCESEFNLGKRYVMIYEVCWSFVLVFENLNSSINILLYLKMSSKYRCTFKTLFNFCNI